MILFLGFDGTLHPNWITHQRGDREVTVPYSGPWLIDAPILESIIKPYFERIDIVIASWWTYTRSISEIAELLPRSIASRIIGSIWLPQQPPRYGAESMSRYRSIQLWLEYHGIALEDDWIALDDDARGWPPELGNHLVHAQGTLASPAVQTALRDRLTEKLGLPEP